MKKIFLVPALIGALTIPLAAKAQTDTEEGAPKQEYNFRSAKPLTQIESLYSALMAATPKGVQKGGATLEEISAYVTDNVSATSQEINHRAQTPTHKATGKLSGTWKSKKLRP